MVAIAMVDVLILEGKEEKNCVFCAYGNNHRNQFSWNEPRERSQLHEDLVHTNLCDPMQQTNEGGAHYFVLFKNDAIGFKVFECIKSNTGDVVLA